MLFGKNRLKTILKANRNIPASLYKFRSGKYKKVNYERGKKENENKKQD